MVQLMMVYCLVIKQQRALSPSPHTIVNGVWSSKLLEGFEDAIGCDVDQYDISEVEDSQWIVDEVNKNENNIYNSNYW